MGIIQVFFCKQHTIKAINANRASSPTLQIIKGGHSTTSCNRVRFNFIIIFIHRIAYGFLRRSGSSSLQQNSTRAPEL